MTKQSILIKAHLNEKNDVCTIYLGNRSNPLVCRSLGVETSDDGSVIKIYLDSFIHINSKNIQYLGWKPTGAISTTLTKIIS